MKKVSLLQILANIRANNNGHITFHFEDGGKQSQAIRKEIFLDEKGKNIDLRKVIEKIQDISWDLKAKSFFVE